MSTPFQYVPAMAAVARMYTNRSFIADLVLPRVQTPTIEFQYPVWALERNFTLPPTKVGRLSPPNRIEDSWTLVPNATQDYGLDHPIPMPDITNAANQMGLNIDLRTNAAMFLTWLTLLDRENRVSNLIFDTNNYGAGLTLALSGNSQWTDKVNSTPLDDCMAALNAPYMRPNQVTFGNAAWQSFKVHPQIVQSVRGAINPGNNAATQGVVNASDIAQLLGVDRVLVGDARINTAKEGETPNIVRVWEDSVAFHYINPSVGNVQDRLPTWGYTAQFQDRVSGTLAAPNMGLRGGLLARVGESVKELVVSPHAGYLITNTNA